MDESNSNAINKKSILVGVGDYAISFDQEKEIKTYSLGSCIGVVIYSPVKQMAGLLHFALPHAAMNEVMAKKQPAMFADTGMQAMLDEFLRFGGNPWNSFVKIAGGNSMLDENNYFAIGEKNKNAIYEVLEFHNLHVVAADIGGDFSRTLTIDIATGKILLYSPKIGTWEL